MTSEARARSWILDNEEAYAMSQDEFWMKKALSLARQAGKKDEVPVGAILVAADGKTVLGKAMNRREEWTTPLGHAELIAIHRASQKQKAWRLVYGATDPKGGAVHSLYKTLEDSRLNHRCEVIGGVLGDECGSLLKDYFRAKRSQKKIPK
jgi:tRNA(adenine34) deaminase